MNEKFEDINIDSIEIIENSRIRIDKEDLNLLSTDIRHKGLIQPIRVWFNSKNKKYILIAGHRRLEACKLLGWESIPAIVEKGEFDFQAFMGKNVSENVHRKDLSPLEIARICGLFLDAGKNISQIAIMLTLPKKRISQCLTLIGKVPTKFKEDISFYDNSNRGDRSSIPVTVASTIVSTRRKVSQENIEELFDLAKRKEMTVMDMNILKIFVSKGMTIAEAEKKLENTQAISLTLLCNRAAVYQSRKKGKFSDLIKNIISGTEKPNKALLFDAVGVG